MPVGEVILQFLLAKLCPFFDLEFSKRIYSQALASACGALVITKTHLPIKHCLLCFLFASVLLFHEENTYKVDFTAVFNKATKMITCFGKSCSFVLLCVFIMNVYQFEYVFLSFWFRGRAVGFDCMCSCPLPFYFFRGGRRRGEIVYR